MCNLIFQNEFNTQTQIMVNPYKSRYHGISLYFNKQPIYLETIRNNFYVYFRDLLLKHFLMVCSLLDAVFEYWTTADMDKPIIVLGPFSTDIILLTPEDLKDAAKSKY